MSLVRCLRPVRHAGWLLPLGLLAACDSKTTSEMVTLSFESDAVASIDDICSNGGCDSDVLDVTVTYEGLGFTPDDAEIDFEQYRVDYALFDSDETVPYYANILSTSAVVNDKTTIEFTTAGSVQRDWMFSRYGWDTVDGTATLTLQGYDYKNEIVEVSVDFEASFGDFNVSTQ